jgi:hypothetical protein
VAWEEEDGEMVHALFTAADVKRALARAIQNPEDIPEMEPILPEPLEDDLVAMGVVARARLARSLDGFSADEVQRWLRRQRIPNHRMP